jgi:hypothetical protein
MTVIRILLEDLFVFLVETYDIVVVGIEFVFSVIDSIGLTALNFFGSIKSFFVFIISWCANLFVQCYHGCLAFVDSFGDFFSLLGSSIVLLAKLVPRTAYLIANVTSNFITNSYTSAKHNIVDLIGKEGINFFLSFNVNIQHCCNAPEHEEFQ